MSLEALIKEAVMRELSPNGSKIPVGISARHIHLSKEDLEVLFGRGYELRFKKQLMGSEFAAEERVTVVGCNLRVIENVRILGPVRSKTQVEISRTDALKLGVNPPVRDSGDLKGSYPLVLVGPSGVVRLKEGCIIAKRHIHMTPEDAKVLGVKDKDVVSVELGDSIRKGVLDQVLIRVKDNYRLEMHIDTDEANALGVGPKDHVSIKA